MKKLTNSISPFIMLLVPVFLLMAVLFVNADKNIPAARQKAGISLQMPALKSLVQACFNP